MLLGAQTRSLHASILKVGTTDSLWRPARASLASPSESGVTVANPRADEHAMIRRWSLSSPGC